VTFALVRHGHLPRVRRNGTHPLGEERPFRAWTEAYPR